MNKIYKYIYLNIYALLLDFSILCIIFSFIFLNFLHSSLIFIIIGSISIIIILRQTLILHGTYREKNHALDTLNEQNRIVFNPESYAKYMNAPCTRRVVSLSLKNLNKKSSYSLLKNSYQKHFFTSRRQVEFKITFFKDNKPIPEIESTPAGNCDKTNS